jgi:hypothetical protein
VRSGCARIRKAGTSASFTDRTPAFSRATAAATARQRPRSISCWSPARTAAGTACNPTRSGISTKATASSSSWLRPRVTQCGGSCSARRWRRTDRCRSFQPDGGRRPAGSGLRAGGLHRGARIRVRGFHVFERRSRRTGPVDPDRRAGGGARVATRPGADMPFLLALEQSCAPAGEQFCCRPGPPRKHRGDCDGMRLARIGRRWLFPGRAEISAALPASMS